MSSGTKEHGREITDSGYTLNMESAKFDIGLIDTGFALRWKERNWGVFSRFSL